MERMLTNEAIDEIYDRYKDMVYRIAILRMKNEADAADIFQQVFLKLVENSNKLEKEPHIRYWLIRVTINCCNSFYGSSWFRRNISYDDTLEKAETPDTATDNGGYARGGYDNLPEENILREEEYDGLIEAVKALPTMQAQIIHLFYYEDLPISDIADILNISVAATKTRLSRARALLRSVMKERLECC